MRRGTVVCFPLFGVLLPARRTSREAVSLQGSPTADGGDWAGGSPPPPLPARVPTSVVHAPWLRFVGRTVHMSCVLSLQVLLAALENSVSQYPALEGRFCQVLGLIL